MQRYDILLKRTVNHSCICEIFIVCFLDVKNGIYNMGCIENQQCDDTAGPGIVGRSVLERQVSNCHECCSTESCNSDLCKHLKLDGNWAVWSSWSNCDVTCGNGTQLRSRTCTNPSPANGGLDCDGKSTLTKACQKDACQIHGGWSQWAPWGSCSVTCGVGMQRRDRTYSNPYPSLYGDHCYGDSRDDRICMSRACVDGGWSTWGSWDACSESCNGGIRSRLRTCTNPQPSLLGKTCDGIPLQVVPCSMNVCPLGVWSGWQTWSTCSAECEGGFRTRSRTCSNTNYCQGQPMDIEICRRHSCNESDCYEIKKKHKEFTSGIYSVLLWKSKTHEKVYCDMETDGGGWTVFQYRFNGIVDFYRKFLDYDSSFGSLETEFWLGLKYVHEMASQGTTELRLDLTAADNAIAYEIFQNFYLGSGPNYTLHIDHGTGTAGDSLGLSYSTVASFSTYDVDRDESGGNCAVNDHGGWWYKGCANANLNGEYITPGTVYSGHGERGMIYRSFKNENLLTASKMMFRRV